MLGAYRPNDRSVTTGTNGSLFLGLARAKWHHRYRANRQPLCIQYFDPAGRWPTFENACLDKGSRILQGPVPGFEAAGQGFAVMVFKDHRSPSDVEEKSAHDEGLIRPDPRLCQGEPE